MRPLAIRLGGLNALAKRKSGTDSANIAPGPPRPRPPPQPTAPQGPHGKEPRSRPRSLVKSQTAKPLPFRRPPPGAETGGRFTFTRSYAWSHTYARVGVQPTGSRLHDIKAECTSLVLGGGRCDHDSTLGPPSESLRESQQALGHKPMCSPARTRSIERMSAGRSAEPPVNDDRAAGFRDDSRAVPGLHPQAKQP